MSITELLKKHRQEFGWVSDVMAEKRSFEPVLKDRPRFNFAWMKDRSGKSETVKYIEEHIPDFDNKFSHAVMQEGVSKRFLISMVAEFCEIGVDMKQTFEVLIENSRHAAIIIELMKLLTEETEK